MNESLASAPPSRIRRPPLASARHTVILVAILLGIAGYGAYLQARGASGGQIVEQRGSAVPLYLGLIAAEWALVRYVWAGMKRAGSSFRELLGQRWSTWSAVARDVAIALLVWAAWSLLAGAAEQKMGSDSAKGITTLLPRGPIEVALWVALSLTAGFCEEVVFRGYLQGQIEACTGSAWVAVLGQAIIFGVSHGYQGLRNMIAIAVYGVIIGVVARWRRSLKPVMILHAWTDIFSGIIAKG